MAPVTEAEALKAITKILSKIEKPAARNRILKRAWVNFATKEISAVGKKKGMKKKTISKKTRRCIADIDL